MEQDRQLHSDAKGPRVDVFLLTKPPFSERARFCMRLISRSENAVLYLAGDGVYMLLEEALENLPLNRIVACQEDLEARGVQAKDKTVVLVDFYERLVDDAMNEENKLYAF